MTFKNHRDNLQQKNVPDCSFSSGSKPFVIGSQFVQPSMAQDMGNMGQQVKEKIGGAVQQLTDGNQTGNQTGNQ